MERERGEGEGKEGGHSGRGELEVAASIDEVTLGGFQHE